MKNFFSIIVKSVPVLAPIIVVATFLWASPVSASTIIHTWQDSTFITVNLYDDGSLTASGSEAPSADFQAGGLGVYIFAGGVNIGTPPYDSLQDAYTANGYALPTTTDVCFSRSGLGGCSSHALDYRVFISSSGVISPYYSPVSRIVSIDYPSAGVITPSTSVILTNTFYISSTSPAYDNVGYELSDITVSTPATSFQISTSTVGYGVTNFPISLIASHQYLWRPYLYNSTTQTYIYGQYSNFYVISNTNSIDLLPDSTSTISTSTNAFASFFNVPALLSTRIPFAYFYQISNVLSNLSTASSSAIPVGAFNWEWASGTPAHQTIRVDLFSTTTVNALLPSTATALFRAIMVAVTFVLTALYLRQRVLTIKL